MDDDDVTRRMSEIMAFQFPDFDLDRPVEPRMPLEGPAGKADGPGRGPLTYRQTLRFEALHGFWLLGYTD